MFKYTVGTTNFLKLGGRRVQTTPPFEGAGIINVLGMALPVHKVALYGVLNCLPVRPSGGTTVNLLGLIWYVAPSVGDSKTTIFPLLA